ncbi:ABC transporter ATP-binding protein [Paenibacillus naphthalenovorans]|uniref:ABC transporter ATP-binding protein n=1 Tax=Paenibacillus naphthalenovorans TaxID=162209 RepID=UPI003D2894D4
MSEIAISLRNVSKMYKIYDKPVHKILSSLGFPLKSGVQEFWAVRDVSLDIYKGSRVGLIGRNGAGKSTILKMISENIYPSSGEISVNGQVSALLELGTGFHPEFSGRDNIYASLSYMGVTGKEAHRKYEDIVEFSELEEFIDRPIKTYSAGMYARLAFSVATAIQPEILIIDEILGAGDAYFASKSVERMKSLTENGVTVLFVSHDLASLQKLCDQAVWIDRGKVIMQGDTLTVSKAYMASVRAQEEARLQIRSERKLNKSSQSTDNLVELKLSRELLFHLITENWSEPRNKHFVSRVSLYKNQKLLSELNIGDAMDNDMNHDSHIIEKKGYISWGNTEIIDGKYCRPFEAGGSTKHAAWVLAHPLIDDAEDLTVRVEYFDDNNEDLFLELYDGKEYVRIGSLKAENDNGWKVGIFAVPKHLIVKPALDEDQTTLDLSEAEPIASDNEVSGLQNDQENNAIDINDIYGSREIEIEKVKFLCGEEEKRIYSIDDSLTVRVYFRAHHTVVNPVFVVAIYALDGTVISQSISSKDGETFGPVKGRGFIDVKYDKLFIGKGHYTVSIGIFKFIDLMQQMESPSYCVHDRKYEIIVEQPPEIRVDLGLVQQPVKWGLISGSEGE